MPMEIKDWDRECAAQQKWRIGHEALMAAQRRIEGRIASAAELDEVDALQDAALAMLHATSLTS